MKVVTGAWFRRQVFGAINLATSSQQRLTRRSFLERSLKQAVTTLGL